jgi:hypothetical protein
MVGLVVFLDLVDELFGGDTGGEGNGATVDFPWAWLKTCECGASIDVVIDRPISGLSPNSGDSAAGENVTVGCGDAGSRRGT